MMLNIQCDVGPDLDRSGEVQLVVVVDPYHGDAAPDHHVPGDVELGVGCHAANQHSCAPGPQPPDALGDHTGVTTHLGWSGSLRAEADNMMCYLHDQVNLLCLDHLLLCPKVHCLLHSLRHRIADVNLG